MAGASSILQDRANPEGSVLKRTPLPNDQNLDITPMIDVTFLLLIFFLVAAVPDVQAALDLPPAQHGVGVSRHEALIICIAEAPGGRSALVYLTPSKSGPPLEGSAEAQAATIRAMVEAARAAGKTEVLLKAERRVRHREVARVMQAADVEGMKINLAVMEPR
ncbi:MAG: hypothetical protein C0483_13995 [Pirellula sp.]|nr:hypothetical protein [Pirellula sp.]